MTAPTADLHAELKQLIVSSLNLDVSPDSIDNEAPLFHASGLGLDSIDALELAVAIERRFKVAIPDEAVGKKAFSSVSALAEFVAAHRPA